MIVRPAIDIREGQCVQLVGGDYEKELIRLPDPVSVAKRWIEKGFRNLHIIDLDRATGRGTNVEVVQSLCEIAQENNEIDIRVGGGIRQASDVADILSFGAKNLVIGTKAISEPDWFKVLTAQFPGQLFVALEADDRDVKVSGWQESSEKSLEELVKEFNNSDIAGIFVTAIHVEGRCEGTDLELFKYVRDLTKLPIVASGGVTSIDDIKALAEANIDEVVLGAAIYTNPDLANTLQEEQYN